MLVAASTLLEGTICLCPGEGPRRAGRTFPSKQPGRLHRVVKSLHQIQHKGSMRDPSVDTGQATASRHVQRKSNKGAGDALAFLKAPHKASPINTTGG